MYGRYVTIMIRHKVLNPFFEKWKIDIGIVNLPFRATNLDFFAVTYNLKQLIWSKPSKFAPWVVLTNRAGNLRKESSSSFAIRSLLSLTNSENVYHNVVLHLVSLVGGGKDLARTIELSFLKDNKIIWSVKERDLRKIIIIDQYINKEMPLLIFYDWLQDNYEICGL